MPDRKIPDLEEQSPEKNLQPSEEAIFQYIEKLAEVQELKDLEPSAEALFFKDHEDVRADVEKLNKLLSEKNLPSYPVLFFLYLLALRDWVNCVEINSKPLECPQIPERLLRKEIQCR